MTALPQLPHGYEHKPWDYKGLIWIKGQMLAYGQQCRDAGRKELLDLLDCLITVYEDGAACYEDPEECSGYIGNAVKLDDDTFNRMCDILNAERPRNKEDLK